jgi:hypothetical protein
MIVLVSEHGWTDGRMDEWSMEGWTDEWMDEEMDG